MGLYCELVVVDAGLEFVAKFCLTLGAHEPIDEREKSSIKTFCELAPRLSAPFDEHSDLIHVTASAIVVGRCGVVLHLHKRLKMWVQPGGHIDSGESIGDAALREATEETGLQLHHFDRGLDGQPVFIHLDVHPGGRGHTHLDVRYLLIATNETFAPGQGESDQLQWFSWDDALSIADPGAQGAIQAARNILES